MAEPIVPGSSLLCLKPTACPDTLLSTLLALSIGVQTTKRVLNNAAFKATELQKAV